MASANNTAAILGGEIYTRCRRLFSGFCGYIKYYMWHAYDTRRYNYERNRRYNYERKIHLRVEVTSALKSSEGDLN